MEPPTHLDVVLIANEAYARGLAVTLASFLASLAPTDAGSVRVWLLDTGLSAETVARVQGMVAAAAADVVLLTIIPAAAHLTDVPAAQDTYSGQGSWLKLLLHELLPADVQHALYLDCDMLVRADACTLLRGAPHTFKANPLALLAAVRDHGLPYGHEGWQHARAAGGWDHCLTGSSSIATPGSSNSSAYFNAGLLLLNLPAWRAARQQVDAALLRLGFRRPAAGSAAAPPVAAVTVDRGPRSELRYADQDALNLMTCSTGWLRLDDMWNAQGIGTYLPDRTKPSGPDQPALFSADQAAALASAPAIVHFTGPPSISPFQLLDPFFAPPSKPWAPVCLNPFRAEWLACLDTTPWAGWRPQQQQLAAAAVDDLTALCKQLDSSATATASPAGGSCSRPGTVGCLASHSSIASGFDARSFLLHVSQLCRTAAQQGL